MKNNGALKCIDWKSEGVDIFGGDSSPDYGGLDIIVVPCNVAWPIPRSRGGTDQGVSEECSWDKEKALDYLYGGLNIVIMNNAGQF